MTKSALLIIDVQIDNVDPNGPYPFPKEDVDKLIAAINKLTDQWRAKDQPILFVRQVFKGVMGKLISRLLLSGITIDGNPGVEVDPRLNTEAGIIVDKTKQNAFISSAILSVLKKLDVTEVFIAGLDGAYCVAETAKGAIENDFPTHLIEDAIITNKPRDASKKLDRLIRLGAHRKSVIDL